MVYQIHRAVVIGAGTMGAAIAAHLANAGVPVTLLDIIPNKLTPQEEKQGLTLDDKQVRNRIVQEGYDRMLKAKPANLFSAQAAELIKIGNLEDDLQVVANADWVVEAIVENLKIKRSLMTRLEEMRKPETIISTNTSGIPVASIAEGFSDSFRQHFLGTHFFNPPRYLKLLEIIPTPDTKPEVIEALVHFAEYRLGKGVVMAKDTPNFVANRLGFGSGAFAMHYILDNDYTVDEVDAITGPAMGRPKTATFRLVDLVGVDVWEHVGSNLAPAIPHDEMAQRYLTSEPANQLIHNMVEAGRLGNKTKQGFYKQVRKDDGSKEFWSVNLKTLEYEPPTKPRFDSLKKAKDAGGGLAKSLKVLLEGEDRAAQLARALTFQGLAYAASLIPEVSDTPKAIDDAMRWGFNHDAGPFETWDMLGVAWTADCMAEAGFPAPAWVKEMLVSGRDTFYQYDNERKVGVYNPPQKDYQTLERPANQIILKERKEQGKLLEKNAGASLVDLGDGVLCVEFHTKMNALDDDIFNIVEMGLDKVEKDRYEGLVIGNDADNFSAGANLFMVVMAAQNGMWDTLDQAIRKLQNINMRMRYFPKPVVVAPAGLTLGGGAEVTMHAGRVVAAAELYTGLVEVGAGVIPAGGGTKEIMRRIINPPMRTENASSLPYVQRAFEQIGMAKVATSAQEAHQLGILGPADRIVMNRDHLLAEAKREVLCLAAGGYRPPTPEKIYAGGRDVLAALQVGVFMFKEGGGISEHDALIGSHLGNILAGGSFSKPVWVDEQYILDLEREAFLSLSGTEKTQQRMWNLLQTGKPLRN